MNLTLALGLKYESLQKTEFLPSRQEEALDNLKQGLTVSNPSLTSEPVIDVTAIKLDSPTNTKASNQHYDYLSYNMHARLNILHNIGTQLHITI